MKANVIKNNWSLSLGKRLDSKYHLNDGVVYFNVLKKSPYTVKTIGDVSRRIFYGNRSKRIYITDKTKGIGFISSSDMMKMDLANIKTISKKHTKFLQDQLLDIEWILVSRSGTIGNTVFTNEIFKNKAGSEHIMRIIPNEHIKAGFLYTYLSSQCGYSLLTSGIFGAVIQHIDEDHILNLPIPIFPQVKQQEIHNLIIEAANLRVEANKFLEEAVGYFNTKYPIKNFHQKGFIKNVKELDFSWASYNNNEECSQINKLLKNNSLTIGEIADNVFSPPMFKHIYLKKDNGYPFLTGAELTRQNIRYYRWLSPRGVKNINDYMVKKGTLLLYKSGTTDGGILGNVFIIDENQDGVCLSDHLIRIKISDFNISYWIFAFFKSEAGIKLLQRLATGTMIPFITPERLMNQQIPKPNEEFVIITQKVANYLEKRALANQKENQAIHLVEKEIESWEK